MRELSPTGGSEGYGACDDEAQYPGMKAFFNLK